MELSMYYLLIIISLGILVYVAFHKAGVKGKLGERKVARKLGKLSDVYKVFNDVIVQEGEYSSQIDHVVISPYGIFVIETKNYKGDIYGSEKAEEWTQNIWGNKYCFHNPINQNLGHVYSLANLFNLPQSYFTPIVVFTSRCRLYVESSSIVVYTYDLNKEILSYQDKVLSEEQVQKMAEKLSHTCLEKKNAIKEHVRYAKERKDDYQRKIENLVCPKCGGRLIERKGKYGQFLGCSNYPRCKFTHKL
jgi:cytochrome c-type biogenesis protein CcmH/NrfF